MQANLQQRKNSRKLKLGRLGEDLAVKHIEAAGWKVVERNWRHPLGELDIIALDGRTAVAIEVKTRSSEDFGTPLEAITQEKLQRLRKLVLEWNHRTKPNVLAIRVDAIAVLVRPGTNPVIDHLKALS